LTIWPSAGIGLRLLFMAFGRYSLRCYSVVIHCHSIVIRLSFNSYSIVIRWSFASLSFGCHSVVIHCHSIATVLLTSDIGLWTMDLGLQTSDFRPWTLDLGLWTMDYGP